MSRRLSHLDHLKTLDGPLIWVRSAGKLGDDLMHGRNSTGKRFASISACTKDDAGKVGMGRRQCTRKYKVEVVNKAIRRELLDHKLRQRIPKGVLTHRYFGISTDEVGPAERGKKRFEGVNRLKLREEQRAITQRLGCTATGHSRSRLLAIPFSALTPKLGPSPPLLIRCSASAAMNCQWDEEAGAGAHQESMWPSRLGSPGSMPTQREPSGRGGPYRANKGD
jgi:hypothetical protein